MNFPIIYSERLILRRFETSDSTAVYELAKDKEISDTTLEIPHPYPVGEAKRWIKTHPDLLKNNMIILAITLNGIVIGSISLAINFKFNAGEVGYWVGKKYWNKGYASEALGAIIKYAFEDLKLNKIHAHHMEINFASGKVMENNGMKKEGLLRKHILKNGVYHDVVLWGILRDEYFSRLN